MTAARYILGIDPGSGTKSPTGLALYDTNEHKILWTKTIRPQFEPTGFNNKRARFKSVASQVAEEAEDLLKQYGKGNVEAHIEWFVMRGKGGETLQRLIGAILVFIPLGVPIKQVQNLAVKYWACGDYKGDKLQVGNGLLTRIPNSGILIKDLLREKRFDEVDAIAIAYCNEFRDD